MKNRNTDETHTLTQSTTVNKQIPMLPKYKSANTFRTWVSKFPKLKIIHVRDC